MSIRIDRLDKQTILITFEPGWAWDDLYTAVGQADQIIASADPAQAIDLLIDIRQAGGLPRDFLNVAGDLLNRGDARPNEGEKIIIGANWLLRTAYQGFLKVYGQRMAGRPLRFTSDRQEAQQILQKMRVNEQVRPTTE